MKRVTERRTYSYLGPAGTFTEAALDQVAEARGQQWRAVHNVGEALADVLEGRSHVEVGDSSHGKCREFQRELSHGSRVGGAAGGGCVPRPQGREAT